MKKKLRITFACPTDSPSGGNRVVAIYAARLADRGHKVTAVIPQQTRPTLRRRLSVLIKQGRILRTPEPNPVSFFRDVPFEVRWLNHPGTVRNRDMPDADVVIATWWVTAEWVWSFNAAKGKKLHFVQDYEEWWAPPELVPRIDAAYALPIPKIVIAKWVSELLGSKWNQEPIALIPNSVETELFFASPRDKQSIPTVGFTYSGLFNKGCDITLAAIDNARRRVPNLRVIAFGTSKPEGLPPYIEFHAAVPDSKLRELYSSCDAWLFGTRREGFGLPILEAMACRTPVIGTTAGAGQDLIGRGGGRLIAIDDVKAMADGIVDFANMNGQEWLHISDIALLTATNYSWEEATDRFESAIFQVAGNRA